MATDAEREVIDDARIARLRRWDLPPLEAAGSHHAIEAAPEFPRALRVLCRKMLEAAAADKALDGIFKDAGRYVVAMVAVHLHLCGGLTLPRLKELGAKSGYFSAGRARAILIYLQYLNFVKSVGPAPGQLAKVYEPTPKLMQAWRSHLRAALEAACELEPAAQLVVDRFGEREIFERFTRLHIEGLLAAAAASGQGHPFQQVFMHRNAGNQVIWSLLTAVDDDDCPPAGLIPVNRPDLARRFAVSRPHLKRLFAAAEAQGGLVSSDQGVVLSQSSRDFIGLLYGGQFAFLLAAAARTVAASDGDALAGSAAAASTRPAASTG
jgi:AraC-like DNA-binding protein